MYDLIYYTGGFLIFSLVWLITDPDLSAHTTIFRLVKRDRTRTTGRMLAVLLPQGFGYFFFRWPSYPADPWISVGAAVVFAIGLSVCIWAKYTMKNNWGTPVRHDIRRQTTLIMNGPFRYTRNPIYLGLSLMTVSAGLGAHSILFPLTGLFLIHVRNIAVAEETVLERVFGEKYRVYRQRVPRFI